MNKDKKGNRKGAVESEYTFNEKEIQMEFWNKSKLGYVNIKTGRTNTVINKKGHKYINLKELDERLEYDLLICGEDEDIDKFIDENFGDIKITKFQYENKHAFFNATDLDPVEKKIKGYDAVEVKINNTNTKKGFNIDLTGGFSFFTSFDQKQEKPEKKKKITLPTRNNPLNLFTFNNPFNFQKNELILDSIILNSEYKNIHSLTKDEIDSLCYFHFSGVKSKLKVCGIKDGDTIEGIFEVNLENLTKVQDYGLRPIKHQSQILTENTNAKFIVKKGLRLYGIDCAEHDTLQGQLAKYLLKELIERYNHNIYIKCVHGPKQTGMNIGTGMYERILAELYLDENYTINITNFMEGKIYGKYGIICEPYQGGSKSEYMKKLSKITKEEQNDIEHRGFPNIYEFNKDWLFQK